mmetsp:Transcript_41236/g.41960  ORF Transcript_41236/g.41960 Transcript_41236/m.41960 type:complete len:94 (+) Transcript_41236:70-351(+)
MYVIILFQDHSFSRSFFSIFIYPPSLQDDLHLHRYRHHYHHRSSTVIIVVILFFSFAALPRRWMCVGAFIYKDEFLSTIQYMTTTMYFASFLI